MRCTVKWNLNSFYLSVEVVVYFQYNQFIFKCDAFCLIFQHFVMPLYSIFFFSRFCEDLSYFWIHGVSFSVKIQRKLRNLILRYSVPHVNGHDNVQFSKYYVVSGSRYSPPERGVGYLNFKILVKVEPDWDGNIWLRVVFKSRGFKSSY